MLEKPENYEEAKKILVDSATDDFNARYKKAFKLRAGLVTAIGLGVAATAGLVTQNPTWTTSMLPAVGVISLTGVMPLITFNKRLKSYKNGKYFEKNSEQRVMEVASTYVDEYNTFEKHNGGKTK